MAVELATAYISLVPSAQGIGAAIAKELGAPLAQAAQDAGADASKRLGAGLLSGASDTGKKLIAALGLVALGAFAFKSAVDVEDANNIIVRATGATGKALEGLEGSFRNVASGSAASFEVISTTLAELNQRTGLTGKALESLTSEVVQFNRISKDAPITVQSLTTALAGFNVPANEMGKTLDHLFVISQKTGVPLADLLGTLQTAGPIARLFGFSVEFTAGFLSQLNKVGVESNAVVAGLRKAFVEFAKDGREPAAALRETLSSMQDFLAAGKTAEARQLAVQLFGPRGVGLVDAALSGKLSLASLGDTIDVTGAGILDTAKKTQTLSGAMGILRNNLKLALAEFATPAIEAANSALRSVLPTIKSIGAEFAKLPDSVKIGAVSLVGLASLAGPLGQLGQGIDGLSRLASGLGTGFQLAAVRALEFADSLKAVGVGQLLTAGAVTLGLVAVGALIVALGSGAGKYEEITSAAEKWGRQTVLAAKSTSDEYKNLKTTYDTLGTRIKDLQATQAALEQQQQRTGHQTQEQKTQSYDLAVSILTLQKRHEALTPEVERLKQAQQDAAARVEATTTSLTGYNASVAAGADATGAFANLTDDAKNALVGFQTAALAAAGGQAGLQQSLRNIEKAQTDYNDAVKEFGVDSPEAIDKHLALNQAQFQGVAAADSLKAAQDKLIDQFKDNIPALDAQIATNQGIIDQGGPLAAAYEAENQKLREAKTAIEQIPPTVSTAYTVDVSQAFAALDALGTKLAATGMPQSVIDILTLKSVRTTAVGGIFETPQVRLFAEAGPEAVLPLNDPKRAWELIAQSGLMGDVASAASRPASDVRNAGLFDGANVTIGDSNVVPDLDYYQKTRTAFV